MQKEAHLEDGTLKVLRKYYNEHGLNSLYTGWQFKSLQYLIQALFTVKILDYLENKSKKLI